jgi:5'-phosphate synthase pdxT subunit
MHAQWLARAGMGWTEVRGLSDLNSVDSLIMPGGESTTMLSLIDEEGLAAPIRDMCLRGKAIFGTCAGAILLAREVTGPCQPSLNLIDIKVERNAYGRQVDSFIDKVQLVGGREIEGVFIRAPRILEVGPGVEILGTHKGDPVLVRQGNVLAATFHPELSGGEEVRRVFLEIAGSGPEADECLHGAA